jgi:hypothetical protein
LRPHEPFVSPVGSIVRGGGTICRADALLRCESLATLPWARDDDGVREVHSNRIEGFWLGLWNYLHPFRGVSKWCLYLAVYQGMHNYRRDVLGFLRMLLRPITSKGT